MAEYTKNLNLEKPDYDEYYDIGTFNANADKIDKGIEDSENRSTERLTVHKNSNDHTADKIRYDGKIAKDNVKDALDETDTRIDNIVSQGGSDNTEVVDARHSTTKDKTYNTLKGRLEDGEQDIEKLKTDTNVAESVSETSYDSVIPVPDSAVNGQVSSVGIKGLTATNLVKNGDFRNGFEGWFVQNNVKIDTERSYIGSQSAKFEKIAGVLADYRLTQDIEVPDGHKVYYRAYIFCESIENSVLVRFRMSDIGGYDNNVEIAKRTREDFLLNQWECLSITREVTPGSGGIRFELTVYSNENATITLNADGFFAIDLTATFGAGNEPTKEECDQIFVNYFDGTKSTIGSARISSADDTGEVKDKAYVTAVKDNKIVNLKSLPNGVKDEINVTQGKFIKRVSDDVVIDGNLPWALENTNEYRTTLVMSAVETYLPNMANDGSIIGRNSEMQFSSYLPVGAVGRVVCTNNYFYIALPVPNCTLEDAKNYLNTKPVTLIYQLAEPEIIPVRWTGLQAYENGTVYVDTVIPELGFYYNNGLMSHHPDHPIKEVDTLYRVDKETGYKEPLDTSLCVIAEDRLSFTHPDLVDGDLCDWDYVPMTESTRPETTFEFPTNLKASVNSLLDAEKTNKKEHNIFKARLDNHDRDIERIDTDIENAQTAIDTAQSDIDTHKADKNNPHGVTPQQIGAETPSGSQAKADAVQNELITHEGKTEIHRKITISYTEPTNPSVNDIWIDLNPIIKTKTLADWRINEDNGVTILDWSGNGYHGEVVGNVSITSSINDGSAYSITGDGETGFIKTPFNALQGIDNFKITLYAKRNQDKTGWTSLVNNYRDSNGNKKGWHISYINDYRGLSSNIYTTHGSTDNNLETNFTMVLNTIYWIELEYTGEQAIFKCYEVKTNGNLELKVSKTTPLTGLVNVGMRPLTLLANNSVTTTEFAPFTLGKIKINTERKED